MANKEFKAAFPDVKELVEWSLIISSNIGFIYLKMGLHKAAIDHIEALLSSITPKAPNSPDRRNLDENQILEDRYDEIRSKRFEMKLLMSLCILESEVGK